MVGQAVKYVDTEKREYDALTVGSYETAYPSSPILRVTYVSDVTGPVKTVQVKHQDDVKEGEAYWRVITKKDVDDDE